MKFAQLIITLFSFLTFEASAQNYRLRGQVTSQDKLPIEKLTVSLHQLDLSTATDKEGNFEFTEIPSGDWHLEISGIGYVRQIEHIKVSKANVTHDIIIQSANESLEQVVVSGTMKEVSKSDSPVPVEIYTANFFKANPTASIFDGLQNVNGVRPQLNCNICNTGDIHINGLEGPYTMVLIDGMPIVSGLSTVYGLSGIPQSLIDRVEIVKGPASTLYGSEAVGGLINIITKKTASVPTLSVDAFGTGWGEINTDIAGKFQLNDQITSLVGVNYFHYSNPVDHNQDGFTDVTLQNRISVFNKWDFNRKQNRTSSFAMRYVYEDRWGGQMNWEKKYRGGDEIYGESIYTKRWEIFGNYQLPVEENVVLSFSANTHHQNSVYGVIPFNADQNIVFGQLTWNKQLGRHDLLSGLAYRYTYYDDNTTATVDYTNASNNQPMHTKLPGVFLQDEIYLKDQNKLLLGIRYDNNSLHGSILTPRLNYKWNSKKRSDILRLSFGTGYRVANVFTEDHAALTGARKVVFVNNLEPETSFNGNINYVKKIYTSGGNFIGIDASIFHTRFSNKIIPDYDSDANKIIYDNLDGYAVSQGVSLNIDFTFRSGLKMLLGATALDVYSKEAGIKTQQLFTEKFTGVWNIGYSLKKVGLIVDYTGNLYSPMRLPLLSELDPRDDYSPWWSIQNIQLTKSFNHGFEVYGGVKNLLNWTPTRSNPFIIARSHDPFDKNVQFDSNSAAIANAENPYGLTFDPSYIYAPNQGIRGFMGFRYHFR